MQDPLLLVKWLLALAQICKTPSCVLHSPLMPNRKRLTRNAQLDSTFEPFARLFRAWGREGGKKGGKLRWRGVTPEQRRAHAKKAAAARWAKKSR
jgi:hypothetical protein